MTSLLFPCRISVENIELEFSSLFVRIKSLEEKVQGDEQLQLQLEPFLQVKLLHLCKTSDTHRKLRFWVSCCTQHLWKGWWLRKCIFVFYVWSQSSTQALQDLKMRRLDLRKEGNTLIDFFCEDKDTFKLDECFRIFQDFCFKFNKAVKVSEREDAFICSLFGNPSKDCKNIFKCIIIWLQKSKTEDCGKFNL